MQHPEANLGSAHPPLTAEISEENGSFKIRITSPVLARSMYLSFGNLDLNLSDNYFDLLPGETAEIKANSVVSLSDLKRQMKAVSLVEAFLPYGESQAH